MIEYSLYAQNAHSKIQSLNDDLQNQLDDLNVEFETITQKGLIGNEDLFNNACNSLRPSFINSIDQIIGIGTSYLNHIHDYYYDLDPQRTLHFSLPYEKFIEVYLDYYNLKLSIFDLEKQTADVVIRRINLPSIYHIIEKESDIVVTLHHLNTDDDIVDDDTDTTIEDCYIEYDDEDMPIMYGYDDIINNIDIIFSEYCEYADNIKKMSQNDSNILNIISYYIILLQTVIYIIKYIESIRLN